MIQEEHFLDAAERKGRDDHLPAPAGRFGDDPCQVLAVVVWLVRPIAVRRFDQQHVGGADGLGIGQHGTVVAAEVSAEHQGPAGLLHPDPDERGAQQMAGVQELGRDARRDRHRPLVPDRLQQSQGPRGVFPREEGQRRPVPCVALAIRPLGVLFLDVRGVVEDDPGQFGRRARAEHPAAEALADEPRQVAAVIEVRVGEHHGPNRVGADGEGLPVAFAQELEALEEAAVDEHALGADL